MGCCQKPQPQFTVNKKIKGVNFLCELFWCLIMDVLSAFGLFVCLKPLLCDERTVTWNILMSGLVFSNRADVSQVRMCAESVKYGGQIPGNSTGGWFVTSK